MYTFSFCIPELFNHFLGYLEVTSILYYVLFEKFTLIVFKINKTASNNLNEEHRQSKNEELKVFERVVLLLLYTCSGKKFF